MISCGKYCILCAVHYSVYILTHLILTTEDSRIRAGRYVLLSLVFSVPDIEWAQILVE